MKVELEEKLSLNNIEEYAENNLEMTSRSRQQETYINFNTENKVEVVQNPARSMIFKPFILISEIALLVHGLHLLSWLRSRSAKLRILEKR